MTQVILGAVQSALLILCAPLVQGVIKTTKARLQGRLGPPILQPYYDLAKYFHKDTLVPEPTSWLFRTIPTFVFGLGVAATTVVPVFFAPSLFATPGNVVLLIYLLAMMRFLTALAALDTGSAFAGMGASRDFFISSLVEPILFVAILAVALPGKSFDLSSLVSRLTTQHIGATSPAFLMIVVALILLLITETGRLPVDNPDTHLELTMIHEGMLLEYSGKWLAMMSWAAWLKQLVLFSLFIDLCFPWGMANVRSGFMGVSLGLFWFFLKVGILSIALAFIEMSNAKMRLFRVPRFLFAAFLLVVIAIATETML